MLKKEQFSGQHYSMATDFYVRRSFYLFFPSHSSTGHSNYSMFKSVWCLVCCLVLPAERTSDENLENEGNMRMVEEAALHT